MVVLLILIPLVSGLIAFFLKEEKAIRGWSLFSSIVTLLVALYAVSTNQQLSYDAAWLPTLGSRFSVGLDGMSKMLTLLTAISLPVVFISTYRNKYKNASIFYALLLLTQTGLMGVFVATDMLLFYFCFWCHAVTIIAIHVRIHTTGKRKIASHPYAQSIKTAQIC